MTVILGIISQIFIRTVSAILASILLYYIMKSVQFNPATSAAV